MGIDRDVSKTGSPPTTLVFTIKSDLQMPEGKKKFMGPKGDWKEWPGKGACPPAIKQAQTEV
jgi:hypothetical protein